MYGMCANLKCVVDVLDLNSKLSMSVMRQLEMAGLLRLVSFFAGAVYGQDFCQVLLLDLGCFLDRTNVGPSKDVVFLCDEYCRKLCFY